MAGTDDVLGQLQIALVAKLTSDTALMSKVSGVYDQPPVGEAAYPYVTVGDAVPTLFDAFDVRGRTVLVTVHVWDRHKGNRRANPIVADLNRLLDRGSLNVSGLSVVSCLFEDANPMRDPDGVTRHIPVRYRIIVQG